MQVTARTRAESFARPARGTQARRCGGDHRWPRGAAIALTLTLVLAPLAVTLVGVAIDRWPDYFWPGLVITPLMWAAPSLVCFMLTGELPRLVIRRPWREPPVVSGEPTALPMPAPDDPPRTN